MFYIKTIEMQNSHKNDMKMTNFGIYAKPPAELNQIQRSIFPRVAKKKKRKKRNAAVATAFWALIM